MAVVEMEKTFNEETHFSALFWACQPSQRFLSKRIYKWRMSERHFFWTFQLERWKDILEDGLPHEMYEFFESFFYLFFIKSIFLFVSCIAYDRKVQMNSRSALRPAKFLQILLTSFQILELHFSISTYTGFTWLEYLAICAIFCKSNIT